MLLLYSEFGLHDDLSIDVPTNGARSTAPAPRLRGCPCITCITNAERASSICDNLILVLMRLVAAHPSKVNES